MATSDPSLEAFLLPLKIDIEKIHKLAQSLNLTFRRLAKESQEQFLPTPISDRLLRPSGDRDGRYLAIDIGGTNLRVGFIEIDSGSLSEDPYSKNDGEGASRSRVRRVLERSWPIREQLKIHKAEDLFAWIGENIRDRVAAGYEAWGKALPEEISLGVTFSFPVNQRTLSEATITSMGKGFALTSNLDLGKQLLEGYERARTPNLPRIRIAAIVNDAVATLVSFAYQQRSIPGRKAAMGLIVGTGCNATIPLSLSKLHPLKHPKSWKTLSPYELEHDIKIAVNTEWTISGASAPLYTLKFYTQWDALLDSKTEAPGFQPFEYMTAGRYLGELGRLIILDYFTNILQVSTSEIPPKLLQHHKLTTTFLGNLRVEDMDATIKELETELPPNEGRQWRWTKEAAEVVYRVGKAIEVRAAGMTAAAVIGLLICADELPSTPFSDTDPAVPLSNGHSLQKIDPNLKELMVGYTGGCIEHFQDYPVDCQSFLDGIIEREFKDEDRIRVLLSPAHDGGIIGAGILASTVQNIARYR
ncbi:hypothetical protein B7494_g45 [Chlorociboria aeruginascens]|nr:hypothetical protein B7494_g45 [Chlorociboria aeruginascens]